MPKKANMTMEEVLAGIDRGQGKSRKRDDSMAKVCNGRALRIDKPDPQFRGNWAKFIASQNLTIKCGCSLEGHCEYVSQPSRCPLNEEEYGALPEKAVSEIFDEMFELH